MKHSNVSYSEMCESMNFNTHQVSSDDSSSQYKVNIIGFRHLPRCLSKQFSDINDSFSIDQFNSNSHKHPEVFKCFKCYGIVQNKQPQPIKKCRQCQGTSFVSDSHPLVSILEQIISKEIPQLDVNQQSSKKRKLNRRQTIEKQYACPETIKEESFSIQDDPVPSCKNCLKQCENNYYKCDICPNYYICYLCYSKNNFYHHHRLYPKEISIMNGDLNPSYTLKKISEQIQSLQASNVVQTPSSKCSNCKKGLQACFVCCTTCAVKGYQFNLCDSCYQNNSYQHQSNHQLTIKTSMYDEQADFDSINNSSIVFQNSPLFKSQDNLSDKSKELGLFNNSFVRFQDQIAEHESQIRIKVNNSQRSLFQNELQELSQMPIIKSKLSKSYRSEKEQEEQDFSIRFSQNGHKEDDNKDNLFHEIHQESKDKQANIKLEQRRESSQQSKHSYNSHRKPRSQANRSNPQEYVFKDYRCDICGISPIANRKYHCNSCQDFDLCEMCYLDQSSQHQHNNFTLDDGNELLKKQRIFLAKSIQQKQTKSRIPLLQISKRLVQSKSIKKRRG